LSVGFIVPSGRDNFKPFRNQPLVVLYLLTILKENFGSKIKINLIDLRGVEEENVLFHIPEYDVYMYSVATPDYMETSFIVENLRSVYPNAKHIAGGTHITLYPEESVKVFDAVVVGEGEESIVQLINDILMSDIKPLYRQEEPVDINCYPYPDRTILPKTAVVGTDLLNKDYLGLPGTTVLFSRGCPFNCYFCTNLKIGPVRFRSPRLVEEEIEPRFSKYERLTF